MPLDAIIQKEQYAEKGKNHFRIQGLGQKRERDRKYKETEHDAQKQSLYSLQ